MVETLKTKIVKDAALLCSYDLNLDEFWKYAPVEQTSRMLKSGGLVSIGKVGALRRAWLLHGWVTVYGLVNYLAVQYNQPLRSTQPSIPQRSVN